MIFTIICALVLLDEAEAYTKSGLLWLFFTVALMIAGIQVVTWKTNVLANLADSEENSSNDGNADQNDFEKTMTNSPVKQSQLLYEEKHDAHTKYTNIFVHVPPIPKQGFPSCSSV